MCREWHEGCAHPQVNHSCPHRCGRCPKPTPDAVAQRQAAVLSALEAKVSKVTHGLDRVSGALKLADRKLDALAAEVKTSASKLDTLIDALPSAAPTAAPTAAPRIPRKIHQTWKTREVPSGQATAVASWKSMNPEYAYALYTDSDMERMIKDNYSYIVPAWQRMRPVEKADTFRYAILHQEGGFYSDLDVTCARPIREWLPHVKHDPHTTDLLVGFEVVTERPDWMYWYARKFEFCQWTMGARAGHPVLKLVLDMIVEFYDTHTDAEIADGPQGKPQTVNATGPGIWSDALHRWLNATHGVLFDENKTVAGEVHYDPWRARNDYIRVGNMTILPVRAFGMNSGGYQLRAEHSTEDIFVRHAYLGSWKRRLVATTKASTTHAPTQASNVAKGRHDRHKRGDMAEHAGHKKFHPTKRHKKRLAHAQIAHSARKHPK